MTAWEWSDEASRAYERAPAGFEPGGFATLDLEVDLPHAVFPWAAEGIAAWLRNDRTPATVRRVDETWTIELPEAWLKRRSLLGGGWRDTGEGIVVRIRVGRKFDLPGVPRGRRRARGRAPRPGAGRRIRAVRVPCA